MSDEELEQDDLEVGDEEEGEELNAADDGDDSLDEEGTDSERATPTKKAKAKSAEPDELPSLEAKQKERGEAGAGHGRVPGTWRPRSGGRTQCGRRPAEEAG